VNTVDVTLSWCIMMMASAMGTLAHFTAGAPFGVTIGDVAPLGAGLGFGTTLAGASSGMGGATLAGMGAAAEVGGMSVRPGGLRPPRPHRSPTPRWWAAAGPRLPIRPPPVWEAPRASCREWRRPRQVGDGLRWTALRRQAEGYAPAGVRLIPYRWATTAFRRQVINIDQQSIHSKEKDMPTRL